MKYPIEKLINVICTMDIDELDNLLQDDKIYFESSKSIILLYLFNLFDKLQKKGNKKLLAYKAECTNCYCMNSGLIGYVFVGDYSKHCINLLFDYRNNKLNDLCSCEHIRPLEVAIQTLTNIPFKISLEDRVTFIPSDEFIARLNQTNKWLNEFDTHENYISISVFIDVYRKIPEFSIPSEWIDCKSFHDIIAIPSCYSDIVESLQVLPNVQKALQHLKSLDNNNHAQIINWMDQNWDYYKLFKLTINCRIDTNDKNEIYIKTWTNSPEGILIGELDQFYQFYGYFDQFYERYFNQKEELTNNLDIGNVSILNNLYPIEYKNPTNKKKKDTESLFKVAETLEERLANFTTIMARICRRDIGNTLNSWTLREANSKKKYLIIYHPNKRWSHTLLVDFKNLPIDEIGGYGSFSINLYLNLSKKSLIKTKTYKIRTKNFTKYMIKYLPITINKEWNLLNILNEIPK